MLRCAAPGNAPPRVEPVPTPLFGPSGSSRCDPLCIQMLRHGLRKEFGLKMVEDCAQSIGASFRGQPAGAAGQLPATSFYPTKNLGTMGEGGAILTHDPDLGAGVRALRDYGQSAKYLHEFVGYNSRLENCTRFPSPGLSATARLMDAAAPGDCRAYVEGIRHAEVRVSAAPEGSEPCWHLFRCASRARVNALFWST